MCLVIPTKEETLQVEDTQGVLRVTTWFCLTAESTAEVRKEFFSAHLCVILCVTLRFYKTDS
jgi:hypothetical protein